jgi:hypothetical protein
MLLYCSDYAITTPGETKKVNHPKQACNSYSTYFGLPFLSWWVLPEVNYDCLLPFSFVNIFLPTNALFIKLGLKFTLEFT